MSAGPDDANRPADVRGERCLVTGATGFVGRRLAARLRTAGAFVRGVARSAASSDAHELIAVDLAELPSNSTILDDIHVLFHLAAKTHDLSEAGDAEAEYRRVNVTGTARLLAAARGRAVRRIVFVSSVKAMDEGNDRPVDETAVPRPLTPYGRSKLDAERIVFDAAASSGAEAVCLRFPIVYGPNQRGNLQRMVAAVRRGRFPPPPANHNQRSMLHVENAVDALMLAAAHPAAPGQVYLVADGRPYSTRELYDTIRATLGRPPIRWHVPAFAFRALATGGDLARRVAGRRVGFDSDALQKLLGSAVYSIDKIQRELGYRPVHDLAGSMPSIVTGREALR